MYFRAKPSILIRVVVLLFLFLFSSCSEYQKLLKSSDFNLKYEKAVEYYKDKDFFRANSLFEELLTIYKGTMRAEEVYYYYAYCYYGQQEYILAGYHFRNFAKTYPYSKHTEECQFLGAYCYFLNSPVPSLDQSNTYKAINELQLFINKYPNSTRISECNELIDKLRNKLETKSFNNSKLYFNLGNYKAAITSLKNSLKEYPDSKYRENLLFLILKSSYLLAENSIEKKKKERYQSTINEYHALISEYPDNRYLKESQKMYEHSVKELKG